MSGLRELFQVTFHLIVVYAYRGLQEVEISILRRKIARAKSEASK